MRSASANTASMSCSIRRIVSSCFKSRSVRTMRADSSGPIPAIGSSSSSKRGRVANAIAISSWRCSPWLRFATSTSARPASPTRSSAARAGSRNSGSVRASRQNRNEWPLCACTASATLSSAVKSRNSEVIWKERASPSALRRHVGSAVMSASSKRIRPLSGAISPVSSPISVVLPAPFGPMMACNSPANTASVISSDAITPPKRLLKPSICKSASATAHTFKQAVDAAAREQHHQQEQRTKDDLPIFSGACRQLLSRERQRQQADEQRQRFLQHQQRHRADQRTERRCHAAEHHHHDEIARTCPMHHRGTDEARMIGEQRAGETAEAARDDETDETIAEGRKADRLHSAVVRARALDHHAEAGVHNAPAQIDAGEQQHQAQVIELRAIVEIDQVGELAAPANGQAVIATVAVEADADVVDHLREGERDHDEIDAAGTQRQRPDDERQQSRYRNCDRPLQKAGGEALIGQDADRIASDTQIDGMPEAHHATVAENEIEAGRRDRQDDDAGKERHQENIAGEACVDRHQREEEKQKRDDEVARR